MLRVEYLIRRGHRIAYSLRGDPQAPPLLMIRGLGRTSRHWGAILGELEQSFRLVLIDNRGIGRSDVPLLPFSVRDMADDAAAVLEWLAIERAHVLGISLGGMIAQEVALSHPDRVTTLVLGCTRAGGGTGVSLSWRAALGLVGPMRLPPEHAIRETAKVILSEAFLRESPEVVEEWVQLARELPPTRRGVLYQLLAAARHDASRRLGTLRVPTLVITGDADVLIDAANSVYLAGAIPGARLEVLRGAGHDFPTERPRETARLVRELCLTGTSSR